MQPVIDKELQNNNTDTLRIKKMLDFIHNNYASKVKVDQIAAAASISQRECFRCFKNTINSSLVVYLLK